MADWFTDIKAMAKGWQVLIRGKLYYDPKTKQYYDQTGRMRNYGEVQRRFNFNPVTQEGLFMPSQSPEWVTPRTKQIATAGQSVAVATPKEENVETPLPAMVVPGKLYRQSDGTYVDPNGMPVDPEVANRMLREYAMESPEYLNETERWRARRQTQSEMWANWRAQQQVLAGRHDWMAQRTATMSNMMGGLDKTQMAKAWDAAMQEAMSLFDPNRDWAKIWQLKRIAQDNPYAPPESNIDQLWEDVQSQREEVKRWESLAKDVQNRMKDPNDPMYMSYDPLDITTPEQQRALAIMRGTKAAKDRLFELEGNVAEQATYSWGAPLSEGMETGLGGREYGLVTTEKRPWHPETPDWLSKLYGTKEEAALWGTPEKKATIVTPSPVSWAQLSPQEQTQWAGYAEWMGADPGKLLTQMGQMLPQPRAGSRWQPARQRVSI